VRKLDRRLHGYAANCCWSLASNWEALEGILLFCCSLHCRRLAVQWTLSRTAGAENSFGAPRRWEVLTARATIELNYSWFDCLLGSWRPFHFYCSATNTTHQNAVNYFLVFQCSNCKLKHKSFRWRQKQLQFWHILNANRSNPLPTSRTEGREAGSELGGTDEYSGYRGSDRRGRWAHGAFWQGPLQMMASP
jgi:hypothetical protein